MLCMPGNSACSCLLLNFFKIYFFKIFFSKAIRVSDSLDSDQAWHFAKPNLCLNCKHDFKQRTQAGKRLMTNVVPDEIPPNLESQYNFKF